MQKEQSTAPNESRQNASRSTKPSLWEIGIYVVLLATSLVMRLYDLGSRAVHHDESLHSFYSWQLFDGQGFTHNPMMHGPLQFEANAAIFFAFGDTDFTSRLLYAVIGTVLVALPFLLRNRLGRSGALIAATMLTFSPAMLYFSRFARNDILMATWVLGLVIMMWRYIDEGKDRYLYIAAGLLAFAFATKETAYMITALLGLFLGLVILPPILREIARRTRWLSSKPSYANLSLFSDEIAEGGYPTAVPEMSPPVAIGHAISATWSTILTGTRLSTIPRHGVFFLFLITITLPQWSAFASIFQNTPLLSWTGLTLANSNEVNPIGSPSGGGILIAALIVAAMLGISMYFGYLWKWSAWWKSAAIFYVVWTLLYTTFLTNLDGVGSGIWQGLGYWIAQQDVARGNQPWYYYFVITSTYEFLPLIFSAIAGVYYLRKRELFGLFLVFWAVMTFVLFTIASEKMPWLLVNITLPLIILSSRFLGEIVDGIRWRKVASFAGVIVIPGVPILILVLWQIAFFRLGSISDYLLFLLGMIVALFVFTVLGFMAMLQIGVGRVLSLAVVPLALILVILTVRSSAIASYQNGDVPVEMLVYTQTSPDITRIVREIEQGSNENGEQLDLNITIDQTSGFTWPWAWYLRNYTKVNFPSYKDTPLEQDPASSLVLVHSQNIEQAEETLPGAYSDAQLVRHRWWFPESTYRGLTIGRFLVSFADRDSWRTAMDYFLFRKGIEERLGSENGYVFFDSSFPQNFKPFERN